MKRAEILAVGRLREPSLRKLCADYYRRCRRTMAIEERELRDVRSVQQAIAPRTMVVALDERGEQLDSRQLAGRLRGWLEDPAHIKIAFVIGGADGLGDELRERAHQLLALSRLTLGHQIVRLVLAEQLYRAVSILEGAPYHRD